MKKPGVPLEIVLVIEKYFALPSTLLFGNPNIFWHKFLNLACHLARGNTAILHPMIIP